MAFLAPAFLVYTVFVFVPGLRALIYSVQKWDGLGEPEWNGFNNFRALFADDLFLSALRHNVILGVCGGSITLALALFFASLLHRKIRGAAVFRVAFFFPNIIAAVAVAILWMLLYSTTDFGMINALLGVVQRAYESVSAVAFAFLSVLFYGTIEFGIVNTFVGDVQRAFGSAGAAGMEDVLPFAFTDSKYLIYSLIPMMVWTATGFYMVLFVAAMESIPEEYYEAAKLDGATPALQFWHVTLPFIREVLVVGIVFLLISSVKFFDAVWVLESQFPTKDSHVMATVLYQKVFSEYNIGYGAAVAVMLFVIVFAATLLTLRMSRKEAVEF